MLKISRLADYATLVMDYLARHSAQRYSATLLAEKLHIGTPTVSKVLKLLNEAGLLVSVRGAAGGYQLAKPADKISVASIITAIDGKPAMTECSHSASQCAQASSCGLSSNWQLINTIIYDVLNSLSLSDMSKPLTDEISVPLLMHKLPTLQKLLERETS